MGVIVQKGVARGGAVLDAAEKTDLVPGGALFMVCLAADAVGAVGKLGSNSERTVQCHFQ